MELTSFKECEHTGSAEGGHRRHLHSHAHHHHAPKVSALNSEFVRTTFKASNNKPFITGRSLMQDSASNCEWDSERE